MTDLLTIELAHEGTRTGIIVQVTGVPPGRAARRLLESAFELAGAAPVRQVTDPGWWAIVVGWAAAAYGPASVQRVPDRADRHAVMRVERGRMLEVRPAWPMVRLSPTSPWLDLRGEAALQHGPSDSELVEYRRTLAFEEGEPSVEDLARMFDLGVIEWAPGDVPAGKRRELRRAH